MCPRGARLTISFQNISIEIACTMYQILVHLMSRKFVHKSWTKIIGIEIMNKKMKFWCHLEQYIKHSEHQKMKTNVLKSCLEQYIKQVKFKLLLVWGYGGALQTPSLTDFFYAALRTHQSYIPIASISNIRQLYFMGIIDCFTNNAQNVLISMFCILFVIWSYFSISLRSGEHRFAKARWCWSWWRIRVKMASWWANGCRTIGR